MKKAISLLVCLALLLALAVPVMAETPQDFTGETALFGISKYGNVGISILISDFMDAGYAFGDVVTVRFLDQELDIPFCSNFSDVDSGLPALFARDGEEYLMLAINMGDFATTYGVAVKTTYEDKSFEWNWPEGVETPITFTISMKEAGGYYDEYVLHQLFYSDERADYPDLTDEQFANFRAVTTTGMREGILYRTASPINPQHGRSAYADAAIEAAGVTVVMNLTDSETEARSYEGFDQSYYSTTSFIALNMSLDFTADDFRTKLAEGVKFFADNPGVYAVHCTEGKDRAGFVAAILECLMGATYDEVIADYMVTYYNYYGVTVDDPRYETIAGSNLIKTLKTAFGVDDLTAADLAACAEAYLKGIGVTDETLAALKKNLGPVQENTSPKTGEDDVYIVIPGDCLWNLAGMFYGDPFAWTRIAEANGLTEVSVIVAGQTLVIPQ